MKLTSDSLLVESQVTSGQFLNIKKDENPAVLRKIGIDDIIQIKSAYSWSPAEKDELKWTTIPRSTAVKAYQKYFADFVIFGYSIDDVIPFINASDPNLGMAFTTPLLKIFSPTSSTSN